MFLKKKKFYGIFHDNIHNRGLHIYNYMHIFDKKNIELFNDLLKTKV